MSGSAEESRGDQVTDKMRWIVASLAILVGAGLAVYGTISGDQWVTMVGALFAGGGSLTAPTGGGSPR